MDNAKQHWKILQKLENDLANRVRSFLVVGRNGDGLIVATEDGMAFWLGEIWYNRKTVIKPTPLDVPDLVSMAQSCSSHILLLNKRGEIYSMGRNDRGQLGLGTEDRETHFTPQLIPSPHKFISVRCGMWHSLALTEDGKVWAWGSNFSGKLGVPSSTNSLSSPRKILKLNSHRVVAVECGGNHSLALTDQGVVYGWGANQYGQLGVGGFTHIPTQIPTPSPVQSMAAGDSHTLLLTQTGEVYACGNNNCGQLGLPTTTALSTRLSKVSGLPSISQITSHFDTNLSIAMSSNQRCFVWGQLRNQTSTSSPRELSPFYSTVDSPHSFYSLHRNTPHSVQIPETVLSLASRMSRMFDNPETSPDVQFVVEQRTIHAHRIILSNSSDYFARMFSEKWIAPVDPENPIVRVTIPDHSYQVFHAFLRFLYTDSLVVHFDLLSELLDLAIQYLESDLLQACLTRMRTTLTFSTCCLYYQFTLRHSLPELDSFQQELFQFALANFVEVINSAGYQSMDAKLSKKFTLSMANHST